MPQKKQTDYLGFLAKYLNPLSPTAGAPQPSMTGGSGVPAFLDRATGGLASAEPLRNPLFCNIARNVWSGASQVAGTGMDTPTERKMMRRYFGGGGGAYRLSPAETNAAIDQHRTYKDHVTFGPKFPLPGGGYRQGVNFSGSYGDGRLDGLLGSATGFFDKDQRLTGIKDTFDFDGRPRATGVGPVADYLAGKLVNLTQRDADIFCRGGSNPVRITGGTAR